jgi:hypothetical protein
VFRRVREVVALLFGWTRVEDWCLPPEAVVRTPVPPCVWRPPSPYDARWRRWCRRCRAAGRYLPFPADEPCWRAGTSATARREPDPRVRP